MAYDRWPKLFSGNNSSIKQTGHLYISLCDNKYHYIIKNMEIFGIMFEQIFSKHILQGGKNK